MILVSNLEKFLNGYDTNLKLKIFDNNCFYFSCSYILVVEEFSKHFGKGATNIETMNGKGAFGLDYVNLHDDERIAEYRWTLLQRKYIADIIYVRDDLDVTLIKLTMC